MPDTTADELVRAARPQEALGLLQARVRQDAADPKARLFLAQLLAVLGQWDRAEAQLAVCGTLDASTLGLVATYRAALQAEQQRARVFRGEARALVHADAAQDAVPPAWAQAMAQALEDEAQGRPGAAARRAQALEEAPATPGRLDGEAFAWLADADSRLGPMLEVIEGERYSWVPMQSLAAVRIGAPQDLRDLVWLPARLLGTDGTDRAVLLPTRYAGTPETGEGELQMARRTEWNALSDDQWQGRGQRVLVSDRSERGLLEVREIVFERPDEAEARVGAP